MQIRSLLIANRGEIACRIIRTCKRLGIKTVAIYSEPDRNSLHVRQADTAIALGGAESRDSYLRIEAVVEAALKAKVDAVHPGYGFLSENPLFAEALHASGIRLIGPNAGTMRALGDKIRAKELAQRCMVPTVPSLIIAEEALGTETAAQQISAFGVQVGYPLLIKASAGGGGRGMRRVDAPEEVHSAIESAGREALAFFGDRRVFIEKLVLNPRHIEVQLLGDMHGNVTHLFDRDCTMQRRHQKVVEEAPAPNLQPEIRASILAAATTLATEARYQNAGTAEFLLDREGKFYFLEVNSRLQVEHPVTEEHTGVDLVELQIKVAEGHSLEKILPELKSLENHSIEVRICAEDPDRGFAPSIGQITRFNVPSGPGIRIETGIDEHAAVSHYYDPLIAKIIATGRSRAEAISRLTTTLRRSQILGVTTNIPYLIRLLESADFGRVSHDTKTAEHIAAENPLHHSMRVDRAALCAAAARVLRRQAGDPWGEQSGYRIASLRHTRSHQIQLSGERREITSLIESTRSVAVHLETAGAAPLPLVVDECSRSKQSEDEFAFKIAASAEGESSFPTTELIVQHCYIGHREWITVDGDTLEVITARAGRKGDANASSSGVLASPLPGKVLKINVVEGMRVEAGSIVLVLESMKMEHTVVAPFTGEVTSISTTEGAIVDASAPLVTIKPVE
jgi:3-methylcrotonyl-CoA carboxylase alpha subunit